MFSVKNCCCLSTHLMILVSKPNLIPHYTPNILTSLIFIVIHLKCSLRNSTSSRAPYSQSRIVWKIQSSYQLLSLSIFSSILDFPQPPISRPLAAVILFWYFSLVFYFARLESAKGKARSHFKLECGNYIFIVSVAKLSSKNVDSRFGQHLTRMVAAAQLERSCFGAQRLLRVGGPTELFDFVHRLRLLLLYST